MSSEASKTWLGYPEPEDTASIKRISVDEVAELIKNQGSSEPKFQLVDVRRSDLTGYMVKTSINLPAHTLYPSRQDAARTLSRYEQVITFCQSSQGRGPRAAGWLRDAFKDSGNSTEVLIMEGGIKGFVKAHGDDSSVVHKLPEEVKE